MDAIRVCACKSTFAGTELLMDRRKADGCIGRRSFFSFTHIMLQSSFCCSPSETLPMIEQEEPQGGLHHHLPGKWLLKHQVGSIHKLPGFGTWARPCDREWGAHARDRPPKSSRVGLPQEGIPITFRSAVSTVETQGPNAERGGDGGFA